MTPLLIYIAGPYSADTDEGVRENVRRACAAGKALLDRGHWPVIPHLTHVYALWHERTVGDAGEYELYLAWDVAILRRCDGLLYLASSPGADRELALARELGLPVWLSVDATPGR